MRYRLGIDIGGTFTDAVLVDESTGQVSIDKIPSTPHDNSAGFLQIVDRILQRVGASSRHVRFIAHATTVVTNSIIENRIAKTAFVATEGFRDLLEIRRQIRPSLYDLRFVKPPALIPRQLCYEVTERLGHDGTVIVPLDENQLRGLAEKLRNQHVEAVAICLLHSYIDPSHERAVADYLRS